MTVCLMFCRPLHMAAKYGLVPVVQDLISKGASLVALDESGKITLLIHVLWNTQSGVRVLQTQDLRKLL